MPLYDFACRACGESFEAHTPADAGPPPCPACGAAETERRITGFASSRSPGLKGAAAQRSLSARQARQEQLRIRSDAQRERRRRES